MRHNESPSPIDQDPEQTKWSLGTAAAMVAVGAIVAVSLAQPAVEAASQIFDSLKP